MPLNAPLLESVPYKSLIHKDVQGFLFFRCLGSVPKRTEKFALISSFEYTTSTNIVALGS